MTVRTRLLLVSLLTLAIGLGALLLAGNLLLASTISDQTGRLLASRADAQIAALDVGGNGVSVRATHNDGALDARAWIFDGARLRERPTGLPRVVDRTAVGLGARPRGAPDRTVDHYELRTVALTAGHPSRHVGAVVVAIDTAPFDELRRKVLLGSIAIAVILLGVVGGAVDRALRGALDPVRAMTEAAADWSEHDLDRRFALGPPRDEIGGLAATLDRLLERIAASRRHERRFASDVAHELRTPLAVIQGRVELSLDPRGTPATRVQALDAIADQATRMAATVDALLAVARAELEPGARGADLRAIADDFDAVQVTGLSGPLPVEGEPEIVRRALAPLVENARRYARSQVTIALSAQDARCRATVRDDGPGLSAQLGDAAFAPGRRGADATADGAGLGLPLARRLARACGGDVTAGAGPGGCFILELPCAGGSAQPAARADVPEAVMARGSATAHSAADALPSSSPAATSVG